MIGLPCRNVHWSAYLRGASGGMLSMTQGQLRGSRGDWFEGLITVIFCMSVCLSREKMNVLDSVTAAG
jgi:hypothetical protein